jgi:hypothetical protein
MSENRYGSGLGSLCIVGTLLGLIMPKNENLHGQWYRFVSSIIGYNYFVLWSICFYPQILLNYRRKSARGLSNDFAILKFMGWTLRKISHVHQCRAEEQVSNQQGLVLG